MIGSKDIVASAGITYRQLDHWTRRGWLKAAPREEWERHGIPRACPRDQLAVAVIMGDLVRAGIDPAKARKLAGTIRRKGEAKIGDLRIVRAS